MRLAIHAGAERIDGGSIRRDLVTHRLALADAGVFLPAGNDAAEWRGLTLELIRGGPEGSQILDDARESGAHTVLLSCDTAADSLVNPDQTAMLAEFATREKVDVRVVAVVREQLGYVNSLYGNRVLALETARTFPDFTRSAVPAHRFDYVATFGAVADSTDIQLVGVGYPDLLELGAGYAVAAACGLGDSTPPVLHESCINVREPGPVLLAAHRLLHKRLRFTRSLQEASRKRLDELSAALRSEASVSGWDAEDAAFWGWDDALAAAAREEYASSNAVFAEFVWGNAWTEPWSHREQQTVDFAELPPAVVESVLRTVERLVPEARPQADAVEQPL